MSIDEKLADSTSRDDSNDKTILSPPFPGSLSPAPADAEAGVVVGEPAPAPAPAGPPKGPTFASLGLRPEVLSALEEMGFESAMDVQAATLPLARAGKDLMVQSRTGSGKTAAFGIPFVNDIVDPEAKVVQAIVLLPTRELALQVAAELARIAIHRPITVAPIYGGAPMGRQVEMLRAGAQIVCGTPGRILDHLRRGTLTLDRVRCAVLDECDEMLSMGFQEDIEHILERTPESRQTLLFSATVPEGIQRLSRRFLKNPEFLKLSADFIGVHEIRHVYYAIPGVNREQELLRILNFEDPKTAIVFCNTREETGRVAEFLQKQGFEAEAISSDLSQNDRERVMTRMRAGGIRFLVATDVAARGIDIEGLSHVFNYTFPEAPEIYIHRTGRTGRAGKHGTAISLIGPTEVGSFYYLKLLYKIRPEERALPSEAEIRSHREGERVLQLRQALAGEPGSEWRGLARRISGAVDGERMIAALLARSFASLPMMPAGVVAPVAPRAGRAAEGPQAARGPAVAEARVERSPPVTREIPPSSLPSPSEGGRADAREPEAFRDRPVRGERDDRNGRDRRPAGRGDRPRERDARGSRDRAPRDARDAYPRRDREAGPAGPVGDRPRVPTRSPLPGGGAGGTSAAQPAEKEFWEVWSEEKAAKEGHAQGHAPQDGSLKELLPKEPQSRDLPPRENAVSGIDALPASGAQALPVAEVPRQASRGPTDLPEGIARLYLNVGRKDGVGDEEIKELLRTHVGSDQVSEIDVMNTHTYLNVATGDADRICSSLTGQRLAGRDLVCERARPRR